tara:strand:- start:17 stop:265 length:249 start_codon:yes stop_codon:yes gene_type:complete
MTRVASIGVSCSPSLTAVRTLLAALEASITKGQRADKGHFDYTSFCTALFLAKLREIKHVQNFEKLYKNYNPTYPYLMVAFD